MRHVTRPLLAMEKVSGRRGQIVPDDDFRPQEGSVAIGAGMLLKIPLGHLFSHKQKFDERLIGVLAKGQI